MDFCGDFEEVLAAARRGDGPAWAALYAELAPRVLGYLRAQGAAEPEDLTGEVFLQIVRDLARFTGGERAFRAWVFTIAHHRLLDERRRAGRRPAATAPVDDLDSLLDSPGVDEDVGPALGEERVRRLIAPLPPDQRTVLFLRILGDLTIEETARLLGKRPGAVKALQRRGLAAVERAIAKDGVPL